MNRSDPALPRIDGPRLWQSLMDMAEIGATPRGGVRRLALTDDDRRGRDRFVAWCTAARLAITVDAVGNIFARRAGVDPLLPPVTAGSHLDTQPSGGRFDGCYGVMAALEVCRTLDQHGIRTRHPIEVAVWTNEEGTRFTPVMEGSGVFAGRFTLDAVRAQVDDQGITMGDALDAIGYRGDAPVGHPVAAYFEAHIEQGPVLEREGATIGVVSGGLGQRWFDVILTGTDAHAGPTPMEMRRDALQGAARLITEVDAAGRLTPETRATVGYLVVDPNSRNVIPGRVRFSVDFRAPAEAELDAMERHLRTRTREIADACRLDATIVETVRFAPTPFAPACIAAVRDAADALDLPWRELPSGAGHDAIYLAGVCPTGMIFVPCKDGLSHNEQEHAEPAHLAAGCDVLLRAVLRFAGIA